MQKARNTNINVAHLDKLIYIEGLRGLSILLVVAAHIGTNLFSGGYVGVDVFFVISGFLITRIILVERVNNGRFDFASFYFRRVRRLFPALFLMIISTSLAAATLLAPLEQIRQAETARAASLWYSNFLFLLRDVNYFSATETSNLFLHTWSLGVEEQFYIVWPLLITFIFLIGTANRQKTIGRLGNGLILIFISSLIACVLVTKFRAEIAFYMMPLRAWQFALGALLSLASISEAHIRPGGGQATTIYKLIGKTAGAIGLILIVGSAIALSPESQYPGWRSIFPTLGAALIIASFQFGGSSSHVIRLLTFRPLLILGALSYSWYLWHWPVIKLLETIVFDPSVSDRMMFAAASLGIAAITYYLVENPIRRMTFRPLSPQVVIVSAACLAFGVFVGAGYWRTSATGWITSPSQLPYLQVREDVPKIYPLGCDSWYFSPEVKPCSFGKLESAREVVILGDSVVAQWFSPLEYLYNRHGYKVTVITKSSCPLINAQIQYRGSRFVVCEQWREDAVRKIEERAPDVVIVGSSAGYGISLKARAGLTAPLMRRLSLVTDELLIFAPTPSLPANYHLCGARSDWRRQFSIRNQKCEIEVKDGRHIDVTNGLHSIAANLPNARVIDLNPFVCPNKKCQVVKHGLPVFRNEGHVSNWFAVSIAPLIAKSINLPVNN
jgi:peptidoglycan/LPS O-acetylase OafA/YrhL